MADHGDFRALLWTEKMFATDDKEDDTVLVSIDTPGDGSCFYHALAYCYYIPYRTGLSKKKDKGNVKYEFKERRRRIEDFRYKLASHLDQLDKINNNGKTYYANINGGALVEFYDILQQQLGEQLKIGGIANHRELEDCRRQIHYFSLEGVRNRLANPREFFEFTFLGFISDWTNKDIYILDEDKEDVYLLNEPDKFYKGRNSIIINYREDARHFESVALWNKVTGDLDTYFTPENEVIIALRKRINAKLNAAKKE